MKNKDGGEEALQGSDNVYVASTSEMYVEASNEYGVYDAPYPWLYEVAGTRLIEPYKETSLVLSGSIVTDNADYKYQWSIEYKSVAIDNHLAYGGVQQTITLTEPGTYALTVHAVDPTTKTIVAEYSTLLICKYVKREIRSLTLADREKFLDAMAALWKYNQEDGLALYGAKFTSIATFVAAHSMASNDIMCDAFHDGSGFLTHHLALTNSFEASIRAVDPSVTLPYWDFTIEGEAIAKLDQKPSYMLEITPVFTDEWFGSVDKHNHIADSRWAHAQMPMQTDALSSVKNSYGIIRSYWNNNPETEVGRVLFSTCGVEPVLKLVPVRTALHCTALH